MVRLGGRTMDLDGRVVAWEPPVAWESQAGPFPVSGGLRFEEVENGNARDHLLAILSLPG